MALKYTRQHAPANIINRSILTDVVRNIRIQISDDETRREMIRGSYFGYIILGLPEAVKFSGPILHHLLLREICHDADDEIAFLFGDVVRDQYARVTGLLVDPKSFPKPNVNQSSLLKNIFKEKKSVTKAELEIAYLKLNTKDNELFLKMSLIYFLELALLERDKKTGVQHSHLLYVDNINLFNIVPWGRLSHDITICSCKKGLSNWRLGGKPARSRGYNLAGCPYALQLWAYDAVPGLSDMNAMDMIPDVDGLVICKCQLTVVQTYKALEVLFLRAKVSLLKSTPLRLYANFLAFNNVSVATRVDWTNVGRLHCLLPWWKDATVDFMFSGGYNVCTLIGKVKQKTLIIWGEDDQIISNVQAERLQSELPNAILRQIPRCGHLPHVEKPNCVVRLIKEFI